MRPRAIRARVKYMLIVGEVWMNEDCLIWDLVLIEMEKVLKTAWGGRLL
jgi:hypothetical protein